MKEWKSTDEILNFAINEEEKAAEFYRELAAKMNNSSVRKTLEEFALEEERHKEKLQKLKNDEEIQLSSDEVQDLNITDYLIDVQPSPDMDYQYALILAMKKEKAAFKLYSDLAALTQEAGLKKLLLQLAQEEARHKLRFEVEYDDNILNEN